MTVYAYVFYVYPSILQEAASWMARDSEWQHEKLLLACSKVTLTFCKQYALKFRQPEADGKNAKPCIAHVGGMIHGVSIYASRNAVDRENR